MEMKDSTLFQDDSSHHFPKIVAGVCVMEKKVGLTVSISLIVLEIFPSIGIM